MPTNWMALQPVNLQSRVEVACESESAVNIVFIGSSRVFRQINPRIVEQALPGRTAFNLGEPGYFPFRSLILAEHVSECPKQQVIVLELSTVQTFLPRAPSEFVLQLLNGSNLEVPELVWDVGPEELYIVGNTAFSRQGTATYRIAGFQDLSQYLAAFMLREVGKGRRWLWTAQESRVAPSNSLIENQGHRPYLPKHQVAEIHIRTSAALGATKEADCQTDAFCTKLRELTAKAESNGDTILFFIPPMEASTDLTRRRELAQLIPPQMLLDYSELASKELSNAAYWHDRSHLNAIGANSLSKRVGEDLAKILP